MNARQRIEMAMGGSLVLLLGAFAFQYIGGLAPCPLCLWQRWPHAAAVLLGILALASGWHRALAVCAGLAVLGGAAIGLYHTGIERGWWQGPASCTGGGGPSELAGADLLDMGTPINVVMCDEVQWSLIGLSMASWNALLSLGLAILWFTVLWAEEIRTSRRSA